MRPIIFCHGLESAPKGAKYHALTGAGLSVQAPDFQGLCLQQRVDKLVLLLTGCDRPPLLIGSSYGGLTALCAAIVHRGKGGELSEMILCAPALANAEAPANVMALDAPTRVTVIHGRQDEIIPFAISENWVAANQDAVLIAVDDDHRLSHSLDLIVATVKRVLA